MKPLTQQLSEAGYADRILSDAQLARIVGGSAQRRYGLVNRALKAGELIRIQRGLYLLSDRFRSLKPHPFRLVQALRPGSYVSLETALAYHGWIPEAVYAVASITPGRKSREYDHPVLGRFTFHPLAVHKHGFLELVERVQIDGQTMLIAPPMRALMDLVCLQKLEWRGLEWIEQGLRIDRQYLETATKAQFAALRSVYKHKSVQGYILHLQDALLSDSKDRRRPGQR